ncbi:5-methyltetrahydropteroyltriglutamate--homocysteine S-methyltransferase [Gallaecimonas mangrovi]|uniref:5-methyltetrahydropteroyltriglutamate-- homocysteine S-methyltransferase n=1 Tax=Gallaecimonas mangrovi TaxID=2291597 RepID=UPI000E2081EC|nr:5-methyltetrahydropteroyltriglutamate--homocysteine S-methyltransferase [Gallaecimonas mangrovi]
MSTGYPFFRADHVGSFLRPPHLKQARGDFAAGTLSREQLTAIEDAEIKKLVDAQIAAGVQAVTDGELRRAWWHFDFLENLEGVEGYDADKGYSFKGVETKAHQVRVTGKIDFNAEHPHLAHFQFLKDVVADRAVAKMTIPSPNMLMHLNIRQNPHYDSLQQYSTDLGQAYKKAIAAFYQAGCRYLQIDDVFWAYLADINAEAKEKEAGYDLAEVIASCARTLNIALEDKPADMNISMHVCRGNFKSTWIYQGGYDAIAKALGQVKVDALFLEYDDDRSGSFAPLQHIQDQKVVLGIVTSKVADLEDQAALKARIEEAAQYLPLEQLALSPQCGFSSTEEGNAITEADQWAKLKLINETARSVWADA